MIANMRYLRAGLAVLLVTGLAWLVDYAGSDDGYYGGGVSRWEHADKWGKTPIVVAAMAITGATAVGLLISTFSPASPLRRVVFPATALSCFMLVVAWFFLTAGH